MNCANIYVADFETISPNTNYFKEHNDTGVLLWGLKGLDGEYYARGVDIQSFFNTIRSINKNIIVYFHNLSFDGDFILKYLSKYYNIYNDKNKKSGIYINRQNSIIYSIEWKYSTKIAGYPDKKTIYFKCSYRLLNSSINNLGKSYNINKHLENDGNNFYDLEPQDNINKYPKRFLEYLDNDIEILRLALNDFNNNIKQLPFIKKYKLLTKREYNPFNTLTSASLSLKLIKAFLFTKHYKDNQKINEYLYIEKEHYNWLKPFYFGALSQFNDKYLKARTKVKNALMIDVNSAYPYQMSQELPYGALLDQKPNTTYTKWVKIKINKAIIKDKYFNIVCLLNWDNHYVYDPKRKLKVYDRYCREQFNAIAYYNELELNQLKLLYDIDYEILETKYQKTSSYLKDYINQLYDLKKHYKETGEKGFLQTIKIILNAGYGIFGKRLKYETYLYAKQQEDIDKEEYNINRECKNLFINDYKCFASDKLNEKEKIYVLNISLAAYVTMKERVYLINKIISVKNPNKKFVLCDTDSVLFANLEDNEYELLKNQSNNLLGGWDVELSKDKINKISIFGSKKYALEYDQTLHKFRFAGINNKEYINAPNLDEWEDDAIIIKDASLSVQRINSGIILVPKTKSICKGNL